MALNIEEVNEELDLASQEDNKNEKDFLEEAEKTIEDPSVDDEDYEDEEDEEEIGL